MYLYMWYIPCLYWRQTCSGLSQHVRACLTIEITLNLMSKSNQFILCKLKCELRPQHATPPSRIRLPDSHAGIISQVPLGLSLPTSFVNCTHLTRPPSSLSLSHALRPCLVICCENYICTISNTVRTICAPLLQLLHFTNCWQRPLPPPPRPHPLCAICVNIKKLSSFLEINWNGKVKGFSSGLWVERAI